MENKPQQPPAPTPAHGADPEASANAEHGIPTEVHDAEPTGLPNSDRHHGEVSATKP